jgi:hypothetical protein
LKNDGVLEQADALIRYYFKVDTDTLNDEKFYELYAKLQWVLKNKQDG